MKMAKKKRRTLGSSAKVHQGRAVLQVRNASEMLRRGHEYLKGGSCTKAVQALIMANGHISAASESVESYAGNGESVANEVVGGNAMNNAYGELRREVFAKCVRPAPGLGGARTTKRRARR